jgi:diguanylate cyclase (GGDEF)-like protein
MDILLNMLAASLLCGIAVVIIAALHLLRSARREADENKRLVDNLSEGVYRSSMDGRQLSANRALVELNGYFSEREMLNAVKNIAIEWYVEPGRREEFQQALMRDGCVRDFVSEIYRHNTRERIWISENARLVRDMRTGEPLFYEGTVRDVSETMRKRQAEARLEKLAAMTPAGLFHARRAVDGSTELVFASPTFEKMAGLAPGHRKFALGERVIFPAMADEDYVGFLRALNEAQARLAPLRFTFRTLQAVSEKVSWLEVNATPERCPDGAVDWFGSLSDVTEHKEMVQHIERLAYFDALTELPNRRLLMNRLGEAVKLSGRRKRYGGVIFMDLDGFKQINDAHGHEAGDVFISKIARRLEESLRESDTIARHGGDEFVILLHDLDTDADKAREDLSVVAGKILANLRRGIELSGITYPASGSMGCVLFQGTGVPAETLLRQADKAMYAAKKLGRSRHVFHDQLETKRDAA